MVQLYRLFVLSSAEIRSPLSDQRPPPYVGVGHCASSVGDDGEVFGLILLLLSFCNGLISLMVTISAALTDVSTNVVCQGVISDQSNKCLKIGYLRFCVCNLTKRVSKCNLTKS